MQKHDAVVGKNHQKHSYKYVVSILFVLKSVIYALLFIGCFLLVFLMVKSGFFEKT